MSTFFQFLDLLEERRKRKQLGEEFAKTPEGKAEISKKGFDQPESKGGADISKKEFRQLGRAAEAASEVAALQQQQLTLERGAQALAAEKRQGALSQLNDLFAAAGTLEKAADTGPASLAASAQAVQQAGPVMLENILGTLLDGFKTEIPPAQGEGPPLTVDIESILSKNGVTPDERNLLASAAQSGGLDLGGLIRGEAQSIASNTQDRETAAKEESRAATRFAQEQTQLQKVLDFREKYMREASADPLRIRHLYDEALAAGDLPVAGAIRMDLGTRDSSSEFVARILEPTAFGTGMTSSSGVFKGLDLENVGTINASVRRANITRESAATVMQIISSFTDDETIADFETGNTQAFNRIQDVLKTGKASAGEDNAFFDIMPTLLAKGSNATIGELRGSLRQWVNTSIRPEETAALELMLLNGKQDLPIGSVGLTYMSDDFVTKVVPGLKGAGIPSGTILGQAYFPDAEGEKWINITEDPAMLNRLSQAKPTLVRMNPHVAIAMRMPGTTDAAKLRDGLLQGSEEQRKEAIQTIRNMLQADRKALAADYLESLVESGAMHPAVAEQLMRSFGLRQ